MNRISLDFKNKQVYIYADTQEGSEYMINPIDKNVLELFVPDKTLLNLSECFTFDFENNLFYVNEVPEGISYNDNFIRITSIEVPDLNSRYNDFLEIIGYVQETLTQEDILKAILGIR